MTDPRRLLEGATGVERAVLQSAASDDPTPDRRARVLAAMGSGAATVAATTASAATVKGVAGLTAWKVVIGLAGITALSVGVARTRTDRVEPAAASPTIASSPRELPPIVVPTAAAAAAPATVQPQASVVAVAGPTPAPPQPSAPKFTLAREISLLDEARAANAGGTPVKALAALDRYDAECSGGALGLEAKVLRIEATALTGDADRAASLAKKFLEANPGSQYAARVARHVPNP